MLDDVDLPPFAPVPPSLHIVPHFALSHPVVTLLVPKLQNFVAFRPLTRLGTRGAVGGGTMLGRVVGVGTVGVGTRRFVGPVGSVGGGTRLGRIVGVGTVGVGTVGRVWLVEFRL